jgi:hypothetical protein
MSYPSYLACHVASFLDADGFAGVDWPHNASGLEYWAVEGVRRAVEQFNAKIALSFRVAT